MQDGLGVLVKSQSSLLALSNETDQTETFIGLENDFAVAEDGWVKISPYGDHPKARIVKSEDGRLRQETYVQRLDKPAAEAMVAKSKSLMGRLKRFFVGIPIYKGHPDLSTHAPGTVTAMANDRTQYGMFAEIAAREDGLYGRPVISREGQIAIENEGTKWLSPFWYVRVTGEANGVPVVSPVELISAGLTRTPNIKGGEALANGVEGALQTTQGSEMNVALLAALLGLANEATEAQVTEKIVQLKTAAASITALANERDTHKTAATTAAGEITNLKTALANERTARIGMILDGAIAAGRITAAERAEWGTALANEATFEAKVTELNARQTGIKTAAVADVGGRKLAIANEEERRSAVKSLVDQKMATGMDYDSAFKAAQIEAPALFDAMKQPAKAA